MRVRSVNFFISQIQSNNSKNGPRNKFETLNAEQADYFAEKVKKLKK